ncbi:solute carrier family 26 member 10-like [Contarinia nasturtii]|uniref:solute carrier family 26 member 10-like n=1 Tax=Contarinia nasturtii TaxID=265458 RepID=UPI0012D3C874|nr:solute carrier family 26 member 10-like [Contarinia nasturtii]XP_031640975.1 solute carrier family 26 member 10-like [Contarinia nasturtii]XP_031640976.1 solute carrier family 26 member 10-like [Contarinia nasturtii]XP_031640977.1 solute carrier family 26 member 10-like [Contarinia nasturtii]XP_031640978.1 solute carrier family 26 member 10-like [Contarinia nasturtii]
MDEDNSDYEKKESINEYTHLPIYSVNRLVLRQEDIAEHGGYQKQVQLNYADNVKKSCFNFNIVQFLLNLIPVLRWLPKYSLKQDLPGDLSAGITVAVMHIPQGMAYGLLAGVSPSSGLYMAFFPTLIYFLFGTSRHISVGTLSVISLMTLKVVQTYGTDVSGSHPNLNSTTEPTLMSINQVEHYTNIQVVTACAFMCGIHQILMSFFRLGSLAALLSEPLVNGFTTGAAVHVTVSQLKDLFGIEIPRHKGAFKIIYTILDWIPQIPNSNVTTIIMSGCVILFMVIMNEILKPRCSKMCKFPLPAELIAVVGGTLISSLLNLGTEHHVKLVGFIPMGLPSPELPPIKLLWAVSVDSIAIAIVSYTITISMALIFAKKQNYEVRPNQELLAMGLSNIVGGMFSCIPNATSLSRSLIQEQTGGRTQIASVVSSFLILIILLWIAPFFQMLPRCVLSGIIVVALKGMYTQALQLKRFHQECKIESLTWLVTFGAVVLVDVDIGLFFGLMTSLFAIYIKGWRSQCAMLGAINDTGIYVNLATHNKAVEVANIKIFQYIGAINFSSASSFKRSLYKNVGEIRPNTTELNGNVDGVLKKLQPHAVIVDLSCVSNIDMAACRAFAEIQTDFLISNTVMYLCGPNDRLVDAIQHAEHLSVGKFSVFPTIHDAVLYFQSSAADNV